MLCDRLYSAIVNEIEELSAFESEILKMISAVSVKAAKASVVELEMAMDTMAEYHSEFFSKFAVFKDSCKKFFECIERYRRLSAELGIKLKNYNLNALKYYESKFEQTLSGLRDLFSLMSLRLDTLRNREYLELQKRTSSLQMAATVIEFVAVFYYTMKIWEHFSVRKLPMQIEFFLLTAFTVLVVMLTEVVSDYVRRKKVGFRGKAILAMLFAVVVAMAMLSV